MANKEKQKTMTDAAVYAARVAKGSRMLSEAAEQLSADISKRGDLTVEIGGFYRTLDHSTVFVTDHLTKCDCDICSGRIRTKIQSTLASILGGNDFTAEITDQSHDKPADLPELYTVVVLRGGHGIDSLPGAKPGEIYTVNKNGLVGMSGDFPTEGIIAGIVDFMRMTLDRRVHYREVPGPSGTQK